MAGQRQDPLEGRRAAVANLPLEARVLALKQENERLTGENERLKGQRAAHEAAIGALKAKVVAAKLADKLWWRFVRWGRSKPWVYVMYGIGAFLLVSGWNDAIVDIICPNKVWAALINSFIGVLGIFILCIFPFPA